MKKIIFCLTLFALLLAACSGTATATPDPSVQLSQQYKVNHDYNSLVALLPYLHLPMTRAEVEALLGKPYCKNSAQCYYPTDKKMLFCPAGYVMQAGLCKTETDQVKAFELTWELVVTYTVQDYALERPEDALDGIQFIPVE